MPKQSRFFARSAVGLYFDIRYEDLERGKRTSQDPRIGPGAALFVGSLSTLLGVLVREAETLIIIPPLSPVAAGRRYHRRGVQPSVLHLDDRPRSVCRHRRRPHPGLSRNRASDGSRADSPTAGDDGQTGRCHVDRHALGCGVSPPLCATYYRYVSEVNKRHGGSESLLTQTLPASSSPPERAVHIAAPQEPLETRRQSPHGRPESPTILRQPLGRRGRRPRPRSVRARALHSDGCSVRLVAGRHCQLATHVPVSDRPSIRGCQPEADALIPPRMRRMTSRKSGDLAESEDDPLLLEMREESMLRVRKCLKLTAFYSQLYLQSQDKHLVHVSRPSCIGPLTILKLTFPVCSTC